MWPRGASTGGSARWEGARQRGIATHDIGAIAFYSGRRVIDVVGLVLPEATVHLNTPGYVGYLERLFQRKGVTHVAVLRNWLEVDNVPPLFVADPEPELMQVFRWQPGRAHLVPPRVSAMRRQAAAGMRHNPAAAIELLKQVSFMDPQSSTTWALVGITAEAAGAIRAGDAVVSRNSITAEIAEIQSAGGAPRAHWLRQYTGSLRHWSCCKHSIHSCVFGATRF